ncbi:UPF0057-domain-containing protein [Piromyces finnis]|uniref:UPF0057-domain-containing protein n=1 Tax=Piromyces finnis TaxID=1754191 RepID=A0A1Y1VMR9_9FUNG|nr:UPF0057-domain-containing protein [Piromyces finnis]|eukprot:ORX59902.1 UPF0057-domain-containing protein [Piromyces finnis]
MNNIHLTFYDIFLIIISVCFPPLGVFFKRGCGTDFCINLILTVLLYAVGVIHAIYIIVKPKDEYTQLNDTTGESNNNVTNIPENAIVVILPGANVQTNVNTIPTNLPPPSYAESEQIAKNQKEFLYPELPSYEASSSKEPINEPTKEPTKESTDEKH